MFLLYIEIQNQNRRSTPTKGYGFHRRLCPCGRNEGQATVLDHPSTVRGVGSRQDDGECVRRGHQQILPKCGWINRRYRKCKKLKWYVPILSVQSKIVVHRTNCEISPPVLILLLFIDIYLVFYLLLYDSISFHFHFILLLIKDYFNQK